MNPIQVNNLTKSYGPVQAVRGVSFEIKPGEIFGLIGPDGAGKTSIIRSIVSLLDIDEGEVLFQGKNVRHAIPFVRAHIGYMPQRFSLYQDLTVEENLRFFGDLFDVPEDIQQNRMDKLYAFSKLKSFRSRRAAALSGGMKQKLALSCMLMHEPKVVVLDEPTFGVDPVSRSEFWGILNTLSEEGTSILVTTAYMDEAELCDRIGLLFEGKILALDSPQRLVDQFSYPVYLIKSDRPHETYEKLMESKFQNQLELFGSGVHFTDKDKLGQSRIEGMLHKMKINFLSLKKIKPGLEDLFMRLMQKKSDSEAA